MVILYNRGFYNCSFKSNFFCFFLPLFFLLLPKLDAQQVSILFAWCTMPNKEQSVQVSDTTGDDSSNAVKYKKCIAHFYIDESI